MALAALIVRIGADLTDLSKGLSQADRDIAKVGKRLTKMGAELSAKLTAPILAAGAALGASSIAAGRYADVLGDLVDQTGLSSTTLQEFRHVALQAGVDSDALAQAAIKLTTAMSVGDEQTKQLKVGLQKLGLSATDATGKLVSMDVLLPSIIGRLQGMSDTTLRNTIAADIFGRSWAEMAPILGMGSGAMASAQKEAHALGLVMSKEAVEAADQFRRKLDTLMATAGAVTRELGVAVMPIMSGLVDLLQNQVVPAVRSVVKWFGDLSPTAKITIGVVAGLLAAVGPLVVALGTLATMLPLLKVAWLAAFSPAGAIVAAIVAITAAATAMIANWDSVKLQFVLAWTAMKDAAFTAVSGILNMLVAVFGKVPLLSAKIMALKLAFDQFAQNSLVEAMDGIGKLEQKIMKSADATGTFTSKVVQLGNALAQLPKDIPLVLPGLARGMKMGVGSDFDGNLGRGPADPVRLNTPAIPNVTAAAKPDFMQAALGGSEVGQMVQAFAAFGPLAALLPVINGALEGLTPLFVALEAPLRSIGQLLGAVLAPVVRSLTVAISYVMESFGWLVRGIGKLIDALPGVSAKGVINAGQAMMDAAKAARANGDATAYATKELEKFASSLSNVPRVLNINALRHQISGSPRYQGTAGSPPPVVIGTIQITIPGSDDPEATVMAFDRHFARVVSRGGVTRMTLATP